MSRWAPHSTRWLGPLLALAIVWEAGCATTPNPGVRSATEDLPPRWQHAARLPASDQTAPDTTAAGQPWWMLYRHHPLNEAVQTALQRHGDITSALIKLRTAQLRADAAVGALLPTLNGSADMNFSRPLRQADSEAPVTTTRSFSTAVGASWELDLWGKLRKQSSMTDLETQASAFDRQAVTAALAANVVRQYWQLAALGQRLAASERSLAHAQRVADLSTAQYDAGAISGLDLAQARQSVQSQQAALAGVRQQMAEAEQAMALLLDRPASALPEDMRDAQWPAGVAARAQLAPGLPAQVLTRRPDLRAAELRLQAALDNIAAVRRSFLPGLSLTGSLGASSNALRTLLDNPSASLGLGLALPFLNLGEMRRNPQIAQNDYELAVISYRQSVLRALSEVENALSSVATLQDGLARQTHLATQARRIEEMTEVRYRAGAIALRALLDAQEARRQAELAQIDAERDLLLAQATLFQALGADPAVEEASISLHAAPGR